MEGETAMTIRQYGAILLGAFVISLGLSLVPAQAVVDQPDEDARHFEELLNAVEVEPHLTGFAEVDDMPSYLAWDRVEPDLSDGLAAAEAPLVSLAYADHSVLAPDGPGGLRWSVLARLALLSILCFAVVFYGGRSNA